MPRFVILHHQLADSEHWDLMLEHCDRLLTWQLFTEPVGAESLPVAARHIGDHRMAYLDYEGPVSGDRGHVRRVDGGTFAWVQRGPASFRVELDGRRLSGRFELRLEATGGWSFCAV